MSTLLSFVIPCYRSEHTIRSVIDEIIEVVSERPEYDYEIIAVNDCSPDNVYKVLSLIAAKNCRVKVIDFAKNMGKHSAILAGFAVAKGAYIVNLDDDFQCPVTELWRLLEPVENEGYDVSTAEYTDKKESRGKRIGSFINSWMSEKMLDKEKGLRFENFSIMKKYIADEITNYKNPYPYLEGLILRVTRNIKTVVMDERSRADDNTTGFTFRRSLSLFINGLTAFSVKPLRFAAVAGFLFAVIGFVYGIIIIVKKLIEPAVPMGYSSIMAVILFSTGLIMIILGLIGEYVGRIYMCINDSPQYVIKDTINLENADNE